ncbi:MAG: RluA family pseudouridine synthase [Acidimicrobiales bacterium]|nr:RluA family pseudouridine synthase [Acidimicrobiales bacterium]
MGDVGSEGTGGLPMLDAVVPPALEGERIDRVVALLADVSRNRAGKAIDVGAVFLDGEVVTSRSRKVRADEELTVTEFEREAKHVPEGDLSVVVPVLYADDDVIVVVKPAGLVVHPGAGNFEGTLVNGLLARYPEIAGVGSVARPGIVHRLDLGTSGALAVARTQVAYDSLVGQLASRSVGRRYLALVWGQPDSSTGVVDAPIGRSNKDRTRMAVVGSGRPARTHFEIEDTWNVPQVSLLRCRLETGRTHQIRVHLSAIGHPLVGDRAYGGQRESGSDQLRIDRPFLHASHLAFDHPVTGERMSFDAPLPDELLDLLQHLGPPDHGISMESD